MSDKYVTSNPNMKLPKYTDSLEPGTLATQTLRNQRKSITGSYFLAKV